MKTLRNVHVLFFFALGAKATKSRVVCSRASHLHIALAIFQTLNDKRYIPLFERIHHAASLALDA